VSEARARAAARSQQFLEDINKTLEPNSNGVKNNLVPLEQPSNVKPPVDEPTSDILEKVHDDFMVSAEISPNVPRGLSKRDSVS
jgi:hypothetical protein